MKLLRSHLASFQPHAASDWAKAAMAGINAQLDSMRVRLLNLKPPMGRVQSACQRRDRAREALTAAQAAAEEARQ
eukprot:10256328-Lingulodinium_polyedra.AAC.1